MVENLCLNYGKKVCEYNGKPIYSFPFLEDLAQDGVDQRCPHSFLFVASSFTYTCFFNLDCVNLALGIGPLISVKLQNRLLKREVNPTSTG